MHKVFVDGAAGTTGLQIKGLLKPFRDAGQVDLISIENYRDLDQRMTAFKQADLAFLCLPDQASKDIAPALQSLSTRIIDTSSAFRVTQGWTFGMPELSPEQPEKIKSAQFVTNPGCFATGAISLLRPLTDQNIITPEESVTLVGASGYSGGGNKLIALHEQSDEAFSLANVFGAYSVNAPHKHLKEIKAYANLTQTPVFMPHVLNVPRGMMVSTALQPTSPEVTAQSLKAIYEKAYHRPSSVIKVMPLNDKESRLNFDPFVSLNKAGSTTPPMPELHIHIKEWNCPEQGRQISLYAFFDNLGKGAGTQAVQNMKLMLGL